MGGQHEQEGGVIPGGHEGREKDGVWRFGGPCLVSGRHEEAERERKARNQQGEDGSAMSAPAPF